LVRFSSSSNLHHFSDFFGRFCSINELVMQKTKKLITFCLVSVAFFVLVIIYGKLNPENFKLFPKCPFKILTGLDCPGCGSQRAIHHLLNLNVESAIHANVLLILALPYLLLLFFVELLKTKSRFFMRLHNIFFSTKAIWIVFAIIVLWWIARNIW
jgi:hypothetical protein